MANFKGFCLKRFIKRKIEFDRKATEIIAYGSEIAGFVAKKTLGPFV